MKSPMVPKGIRTVFTTIKNIYACLLISITLYTFLFIYHFNYNFSVEVNTHYSLYAIAVTLFSFFIVLQALSIEQITFCYPDILIISLLIIGFTRISIDHSGTTLNNEFLIGLLIIAMIYIITRLSSGYVITIFFPSLVLLFFLVELYLGLKQLILYKSGTQTLLLALNGSFNNSGVYSIYLCASLPLVKSTIQSFLFIKKRIKIFLICSFFIVVFLVLSITISRTAITIYLVLIFHLMFNRYKDYFRRKQFSNKSNQIFTFIAVLVVGAGLAALFLFHLKPNSVSGRLFIWKVCLQHLTDNFFTGTGVGNFSLQYPLWQIEYVSSHKIEGQTLLHIDETHVAFNEFLQIFMEIGLIGFFLFIILMVFLFSQKSKKNQNLFSSFKLTTLLIIIAGFSSYPFHVNSIFLLFAISCAAPCSISCSTKICVLSKPLHKSFAFCLLLVLLTTNLKFSYNQWTAIIQWEKIRESYFAGPKEIEREYLKLYQNLSTQGKFLLDYGEHLTEFGKYSEGAMMIEKSKLYYLSERTFISASNAHYLAGANEQAIENTQKQSLLIPFRFSPKARLADLYLIYRDTTNAKEIAKSILAMPIKIPSQEVYMLRKRMNEILEK